MKRFLLCSIVGMLSLCTYAQVSVSGVITDQSGETLIGVNVVEQGTNNGTVSDLDGSYDLTVANERAVLLFSYTGMESQSITVGTQKIINAIMVSSAELLSEVVVSALGYKQNKDEMGSTASTVDAEVLQRSGESLLLNSLAAKASNVQISSTVGDPGAGTTIRIRGANTITGSSNPLIILDGVPISNSTLYGGGNDVTGGRTGGVTQQSRLNDINPNDIESMQILKGASAAALWGSQAANGVLVITTKSGAAGKPKISYKASMSFDQVHERIPMQSVWGQGRSGSYSPTAAESWGDYIPDRAGGADIVDESGQYFESVDGTRHYPIETKNSRESFVDRNWDAAFQDGGFLQHDLSISGGKEGAQYFFSLGRLDQEGIIRESDYDRTNARLNTKFVLSDWLSITSKAGYTNSTSNRIQQNSNTAGLLLGLLRTPPDFDTRDYIGTYYGADGEVVRNRQRAYRRYLGNNANPIYNNPLWTVFEQTASSDLNRFLFSTEFNVTPSPWLTVTLRGGVDNSNDRRVYFFPVGSAGTRVPGVYSQDDIGELQLNFDAIAKGNFQLNSDIGLTATLGWNINDRRRQSTNGTITGFLVNARKQTTDLNTSSESSVYENIKNFRRSNRGYGILSFDLFDQLFVNFSGGVEAASTVVGTFFYPAVDVAWQFTEKLGTSALSFGKLRASWGKVGIQPPAHVAETLAEGAFTYSTYSDPLDIALFGGGFRLDDDKGNPNLRPEIKTEWEIGTDLRFFDNKWGLTLTYYHNDIKDNIIPVELTPSSGFDTEFANAAEMKNDGIEIETDYAIYQNADWNISLFANWARNVNEVTFLKGTETINLSPGASVSSRAIVGQPLGVLFGTGSLTDDNGNYILDDNGFPQLTPSPIVLGDPNPDWRGGLGLNIEYKKINFSVLFEHSQGGDFSPRTQWVLRRFGTTEETANRLTLDRSLVNYAGNTIEAGTTVRGNVANFGGGDVLLDESWYRTGIGGGFGDNQAYNFSIKDATFTRLRELTLGYTISSPGFQKKTKLNSISIAATGRNLFLWDDLPGVDPQVNQIGVSNGFGLDYFTNPSTRSFLLTLSVNY